MLVYSKIITRQLNSAHLSRRSFELKICHSKNDRYSVQTEENNEATTTVHVAAVGMRFEEAFLKSWKKFHVRIVRTGIF